MAASRAARAAAAALALWCCAAGTANAQQQQAGADAPLIAGEAGGWRQGRATFYGGPDRFLRLFSDRGAPPEYGFGDAVYGSCGYTQQVALTCPCVRRNPLVRRCAACATAWPRHAHGSCAVQHHAASTQSSLVAWLVAWRLRQQAPAALAGLRVQGDAHARLLPLRRTTARGCPTPTSPTRSRCWRRSPT